MLKANSKHWESKQISLVPSSFQHLLLLWGGAGRTRQGLVRATLQRIRYHAPERQAVCTSRHWPTDNLLPTCHVTWHTTQWSMKSRLIVNGAIRVALSIISERAGKEGGATGLLQIQPTANRVFKCHIVADMYYVVRPTHTLFLVIIP